jgi:hypothetical protein
MGRYIEQIRVPAKIAFGAAKTAQFQRRKMFAAGTASPKYNNF